MFVVNSDDLSIYATRGDIVCLNVSATDDQTGEPYEFQPGDILQIKIYVKKDAESVVLQKDFPVVAKTDCVGVFLTEADTRIGEVISKPVDYWYEVTLNPYTNPQTFIGYDEDGAKIFKLFPEGKDIDTDDEVTPEDIPIVDTDLDLTSSRPVQNRAIARAVTLLKNDLEAAEARLSGKIKENKSVGKDLTEQVAVERARMDNLIAMKSPDLSQSLKYVESITESTKAKIDGSIKSDGVFSTITVNWREANQVYGGTEMDMFIIPVDCRPMHLGLVYTEDGLEYRINHDVAKNRYYMSIKAQDSVTVAPSGAGAVTFTYAQDDYELKDIRVGADGVTYENAGTAVRSVGKRVVEMTELPVDWIAGQYISNNQHNGYVASSDSYECTDYIEMPPLGYSLHYVVTIGAGPIIGRFDKQKRLIDSVTVDSKTTIEGELTAEDGCRYVRFSNFVGNAAFVWVSAMATAKPANESIESDMLVDGAVTADKTAFLKHAPWTNCLKPDFWIENCYVNGSNEGQGIYIKASGLWATEKIPLEAGASYEFEGLYHGYYAFYDANGVFVSGNDEGNLTSPFTVPDGAAYGAFTTNSEDNMNNAWIGSIEEYAYVADANVYAQPIPDAHNDISPCDYEGNDIGVFAHGLCVGDSITQGGFNCTVDGCEASHSLDYPQYAYPKKLEMISGIPMTNMGMSGFTAAQWYAKYKNTDLSGHDFAIIHLGINDAYSNGGWTEESAKSFENIISKIKSENKNIKIFVSTIAPMKSYQSNAIKGVSQGIRDWVNGVADENVILLDMAEYGHTNDSLAYNCGHLSAYGYWRLAKDFNNYISWYISQNQLQFRTVQFIGSGCEYTD